MLKSWPQSRDRASRGKCELCEYEDGYSDPSIGGCASNWSVSEVVS